MEKDLTQLIEFAIMANMKDFEFRIKKQKRIIL